MIGLLDAFKLGIGALAGAALMAAPAFFYGKSVSRAETQLASITKSVEVLRERNVIDEEVSASDAADLCGAMGLSEPDRLECLQRLAQAKPDAGNGGEDHNGR
jgi:hypothetical protein